MAVMGGALWKPMAVLMMSGLALASLLTLFFVPAGYFLLFRFSGSSATAIGEQEQVGSASGDATINAASKKKRA
jgi:predicted RND superfamily exporter protein